MKPKHASAALCLLFGCAKMPTDNTPLSYSFDEEWTAPKRYEHCVEATELFTPPLPDEERAMTLAEMLNIALSNNPQTKHSWYQAKEAAYVHKISMSDYFPDITFEGNAIRKHNTLGSEAGDNQSSVAQSVANETSWGPTLSLSYTLWDFGARRARAASTLQSLYYSNWNHNTQIQTVIRQSLDAYYAYLFEKAQLQALETDLADYKTSFDAAQEKLENGVVAMSDMLQAKTAYLQKKLEFERQRAIQEDRFIALLKQMGLPGNTRFTTGDFPKDPQAETLALNANELLEIAKQSRPDIAAAKTLVQKNNEELNLAKARLWPTIDTSISGGQRWFHHLSREQSYAAQVSLSYPIFSGFKHINTIKRARAALDASKAKLREAELSATQQVMQYYTNFETAKNLVQSAESFLSSAEEEYSAVFHNYTAGTNTILDLLSALSSLADARSQYAKTKKELFTSLANLAFATGTLHSHTTGPILRHKKGEK